MSADTGGAPRDAGPSPEEVSNGVRSLSRTWAGEGFDFGYDRELGCWWAARGGPGGPVLKAAGVRELNRLLAGQEGAGG